MPHIDKESRDRVAQGKIKTVGDLCYLFAKWALTEYEKAPRWTTIHAIRRALRSPYHSESTHLLLRNNPTTFDRPDIETAADLAFFEFYRLIGAVHEDVKLRENGNALYTESIPSTVLKAPKFVNRKGKKA